VEEVEEEVEEERMHFIDKTRTKEKKERERRLEAGPCAI
jgi:hypothetical protein